jgi:hypothetical protein
VIPLLAWMAVASAHEFDPHIVQVQEVSATEHVVRWTAPFASDASLVWPDRCAAEQRRVHDHTRWLRLSCASGLDGGAIRVEGARASESVVVEVSRRDGTRWQHLLRGDGSVVVPVAAQATSAGPVARSYLGLGIEHLLFGPDHLLFVLGLLGVARRPQLVGAVTAFTVGHATTLCLATLGWLALRQGPVEVCIALSLVWLAREIASPDPDSLARRAPWLAAGGFGLLHGLGFAGALAELGLPDGQLVAALAAFNVGIEVGQLGVLGLALLAIRLAPRRAQTAVAPLVPYAIGGLAVSWVLARSSQLFGA